MEKAKIALLYGDPAGIGPTLSAKLLQRRAEDFSPVLVGNEKIFTAALSRVAPELIDRFPVYDVTAGFIVRGESSAAGGRMQAEAMGKAAHLLLAGRVKAILVTSSDGVSRGLYDPRLADEPELVRRAFPGRDVTREFVIAGAPLTLYRTEKGDVAFDACLPHYGEKDPAPADEAALNDALTFLLSRLSGA